MFSDPRFLFIPEPLDPDFDLLVKDYDNIGRRIRKFLTSSQRFITKDLNIRNSKVKNILEELTQMSGVPHDRDLFIFWCLYYYPNFFIDNIDVKFDLDSLIRVRVAELLEMISEIQTGSNENLPSIDTIVSEIREIFGSNFPIKSATLLNAAEVFRIKKENLMKAVRNVRLGKEEEEEKTDYELFVFELSFFGYYESILLLPEQQRERAVELLISKLEEKHSFEKHNLEEVLNEWISILNIEDINISKHHWYKKDTDSWDKIKTIRKVLRFYRDEKFLETSTYEERVEIVKYIFFLKDVEITELDLSEMEVNLYILCHKGRFSSRESRKLSEDDYMALVIKIFSETLLAERALFSDNTPSIENIPDVDELVTYGLELGKAEAVNIEIIGMPCSGKSTITKMFQTFTNAYAEDEIVPEIIDLARKGIIDDVDSLRLMPLEELKPERLKKLMLEAPPEHRSGLAINDPEFIANLSRVRKRDVKAKYKVLTQDVFNQNAFFQAMILAGRTVGLAADSLLNVFMVENYMKHLYRTQDEQIKNPTLVVFFLSDYQDIMKRREEGQIINKKFLKLLFGQYIRLLYELRKPKKNQPPLGILVLDCSRNDAEQNFNNILTSIGLMMGRNANDLMKEA